MTTLYSDRYPAHDGKLFPSPPVWGNHLDPVGRSREAGHEPHRTNGQMLAETALLASETILDRNAVARLVANFGHH